MSLANLASGPALDLAIVGGGINGCAIAEEAAASGLRVALFEASDFGFGTTWRSTKLIHGGLRYLEHGDVRLVFESLRERAWLLKTRDYLVRPQRFVLPVLPWTRRPAWQLGLGLSAYDLLALYRGVPSHRRLSDARLHELAPCLPAETDGGFTFFDARVVAPERLCLELALAAERDGAVIANHTKVTRVGVEAGHVRSVEVEHNGERFEIPTNAVINAAGPWIDAVLDATPIETPDLLGVTRGTHILVELDERPGRDAVFSTAESDGRVFFAVPQDGLLLIGTTDDRYDGDPGDVRPTGDDVDYLLREARLLLPGLDITRERIRFAYAGLRPLQRVSGGPEAAISRRHALLDHSKQGAQELWSVVGGKLSTFRPLAREAVARLDPPSRAHHTSEPIAPGWRETLRASGLPIPVQRHLRMYGGVIGEVIAAGSEIVCEHANAITGEIVHSCEFEHVETLADLMMRRSGISWSACRGLCCHERVSRLAARCLGWTEDERQAQVQAFEAEVAYHLPTEQSLAGSTSAVPG